MATFLISIAVLSVIVCVVTTILIYNYLKNAGEKVSFLWLRLFMISNVSRYKKLTKERTGKTGPLFYAWIISINLALICVIILFAQYPKILH